MALIKNLLLNRKYVLCSLLLTTNFCIAQVATPPDNVNNNIPAVSNMSVDEAVNRIASSNHAFSKRNPDTLIALEVLKVNPVDTVGAIKQRDLITQFSKWLTEDNGDDWSPNPLDIMIVTLGELEHNDANGLLGQWYIALQQHRQDSATNNKILSEIIRHQFLILHHLRGRYVDTVANSIITRLPEMDKNERQLSLVYLVTSTKGQTKISDQLKQLAATHEELAEDSFMQQTLDALANQQ